GRAFSVSAERFDNFDGDIHVEIADLPRGFSASTPLVIQAGQTEAKGTINAAPDAAQPSGTNAAMTKVTARAMIEGKAVAKEVNNFGKIALGDKPKLFVSFEANPSAQPPGPTSTGGGRPFEITIAPGETVPAW